MFSALALWTKNRMIIGLSRRRRLRAHSAALVSKREPFRNRSVLPRQKRNGLWRQMSHLCHSFRIRSACRLDTSFSLFTMVKVSTRKMKAAKASRKSPRCLQKNFQALLAVTSAALAVNSIAPLLFPTPMNTSILTGIAWLKELLGGHSVYFYDAISMPKHVFRKLV